LRKNRLIQIVNRNRALVGEKELHVESEECRMRTNAAENPVNKQKGRRLLRRPFSSRLKLSLGRRSN
jgi:hypothetical protein